jgi:hypothetical protein
MCFVALIMSCYEFQVKRNIDLVYGGGSVGLMGLISQKMYNGGCHVLGYAYSFAVSFVLLLIDDIIL